MTKKAIAAGMMLIGSMMSGAVYAEDDFSKLFNEKEMILIEKNSEIFVKRLLAGFQSMAPKGILNQDMVVTHTKLRGARARSTMVARVMMFDLDGDFVITKKELDEIAIIAPKDQFDKGRVKIMEADKEGNGDGNVSISEVNRLAIVKLGERGKRNSGPRQMMRFDLDEDGKVESKEVESIGFYLKQKYPVSKRPGQKKK